MTLDEFIAALNDSHFMARRPTDPRPTSSRCVIVSDSEYVDGGFSLTLSDGHPVIVDAIAYVIRKLGFEVQCKGYDPRMEAWPLPKGGQQQQ